MMLAIAHMQYALGQQSLGHLSVATGRMSDLTREPFFGLKMFLES
jgi:hypothetical protein